MQIVIDIDEHLYKTIKTLGLVVEDRDAVAVSEAIMHGTPLPKGHGRLIDADALNISHGVFLPKIEGNTLGCAMDAVFADEIDDAPTIIEADTESEG